jgi:integrase
LALLGAVEEQANERVAAKNHERKAVGEVAVPPIQFIKTRDANGRPNSALWSLHSLRATFVTHMIRMGLGLEVVSKIVGHATLVMTAYYIARSAAEIRDIVQQRSCLP